MRTFEEVESEYFSCKRDLTKHRLTGSRNNYFLHRYLMSKRALLKLYQYKTSYRWSGGTMVPHCTKIKWSDIPKEILEGICKQCTWRWNTGGWERLGLRKCEAGNCIPIDKGYYLGYYKFYKLNDSSEILGRTVYIAMPNQYSPVVYIGFFQEESPIWRIDRTKLDDFQEFFITKMRRQVAANKIKRWYRKIKQHVQEIDSNELEKMKDLSDFPEGACIYF